MKILIAIISPSFLCGFVEALYSCTIIMPAESKKGTKPVVYLRGKRKMLPSRQPARSAAARSASLDFT